MIRRKKIEVTRPSGRPGVPLVDPVGDDVCAGGVRLNAGRTHEYFEPGERTIGPPGTLENWRNRLRAQEGFSRGLGRRRIETSEHEQLPITA